MEKKLINLRLPVAIVNRVKEMAYTRSSPHLRVTETSIYIKAIEKGLDMKPEETKEGEE